MRPDLTEGPISKVVATDLASGQTTIASFPRWHCKAVTEITKDDGTTLTGGWMATIPIDDVLNDPGQGAPSVRPPHRPA